MQEGLILCRFVHFGAVLLLVGAGLFRVLFARSLCAFEASPKRGRLDRYLQRLTAVALISALCWLMLTAASMADDWRAGFDLSTLGLVLGNTFYGHVWVAHLGLNLLALILASSKAASARGHLLIQGLLLLTLAPVGHGAMFDGLRGQLLILNQMLHLIGVATWLGGLLMLAVLLKSPSLIDLRAVLLRFSGLGYAMVALIIMTGWVNVRALSGGLWPEPAFSGFGAVLGVKVALVLCMLALALLNRCLARARVLPVLALRSSVVLECLFGGAALAAVSLLGTLPPMSG